MVPRPARVARLQRCDWARRTRAGSDPRRLRCRCEFRRSRTSNAVAADVGRGWLVSAARRRRIESPDNASTRETAQQWTA